MAKESQAKGSQTKGLQANSARRYARIGPLPDLSQEPPDKDYMFPELGLNPLGFDSYYEIQTDIVRGYYAGERAEPWWVDIGGER